MPDSPRPLAVTLQVVSIVLFTFIGYLNIGIPLAVLVIISETDIYGRITKVNDVFCWVSGYSSFEMVGQPHSIIRHPDMPKFVFKMLWDNLKQENNFVGMVKNLAKSGEYYWVVTDFEIQKDAFGNVMHYVARRKSVPQEVVTSYIVPLYETLLKLERIGGMELSSRFFKNYLDKQGKDYMDFIISIMGESKKNPSFEETPLSVSANKEVSDDIYTLNNEMNEKRRSFFARLFS